MFSDKRGLELSAATADAASAFDHVLDGYLSMRRDTGDRLKALFAADADMPMAFVLKSYFCMLMATGSLQSAAQKAAAEARARAEAANERERLHIEAAENWSHGRKRRAIACWEAILAVYPLDILALRLAHHGHFYEGNGQNLRDTIARRLHAWNEDVPDFGFVLGMLAFGLEETHAYDAAIETGKRALAQNPVDPWAVHAVAHVHEMRDAHDDGIAWIDANADGWQSANGFRYHVWWHRMLMQIDKGDYADVLSLYDNTLWDPDSDEYLDLVNDAAVLLRLELHGQDVGDRWHALAEKCAPHVTDQILAFIDVHYGIALTAAGHKGADELMQSLQGYAGMRGEENAQITRDVGIPLVEAVMAHRAGQYDAVIEILLPIRYDFYRMGGSHAQRDLFAMVLIDAAIKGGRQNVASMLLSERLLRLPTNAWTLARAGDIGLAA